MNQSKTLVNLECQTAPGGFRCRAPASCYVFYTDFKVSLAVCETHAEALQLRPDVVPLDPESKKDKDRLYKEARQWEEWRNENDLGPVFCGDENHVVAAPDVV